MLRLEGLSGDLPLAVQVSPTMFCVFGPVTANNPAGYCHVKVQDDSVRCCSKDCKTIVAKGKQLKAKNICIHVHILISLGVILFDKSVTRSSPASTSSGADSICTNAVGSPASEIPSSTKEGSMDQTIPNSTAIDEPVDSISRTSTVQLNMKRSLPLQIPSAVIQQAHVMDINGSPPSLAPSCVTCGLCSGPLTGEKSHPGQRGESLVLTNLTPFRKIKLLVKFCQSPGCQAMHQVFPYDIGNKKIFYKLKVN